MSGALASLARSAERKRQADLRKAWADAAAMGEARRLSSRRSRLPHYQIPADIWWNGVFQNGYDAMKPGSGYFEDMMRRHPELGDPHDKPPSAHKANKVFRGGRWWRRVPGRDAWEPEPQTRRRPWWCEE